MKKYQKYEPKNNDNRSNNDCIFFLRIDDNDGIK